MLKKLFRPRSRSLRNLFRIATALPVFLTAAAGIFFAFQPLSEAQQEELLPPGKYRLEMIMTSTTRVPFFGSSKSASKSVSLVEIRRDGNELIQNHQVCDFRVLEDSKFIKMIFPEKFIAALSRPYLSDSN